MTREIPTAIRTEFLAARKAFVAACADPLISLADYGAVKTRYDAAMKARHVALGFGEMTS